MKSEVEKSSFDSFQLEEYKNISVSHFESIKQISTFFQYYLLTLGAPAFILGLVSSKTDGFEKFFLGKSESIHYNIVSIYFLVIALVGFFIYLYVINLRHDAILYAKSVNKVRRYFFESSPMTVDKYSRFANLPMTGNLPKYGEHTFFAPLMLVFSLINVGMLSSAFAVKLLKSPYFLYDQLIHVQITPSLIVFISVLFACLHLFAYKYLSYRRQNFYLRSYSIGIDIDGVLNDQTAHFARFLKMYTGKDLDLSLLKEIPVHLNQSIGVEDVEERLIFNTREYWSTLPLKDGAVKRINDIHKRFGLEVYFFSYRDWPQYSGIEEKSHLEKKIKEIGYTPLGEREISSVTQEWLNEQKIDAHVVKNLFDRIMYKILNLFRLQKSVTLEMGNPYVSDRRFTNRFRRRILNNNRFQGAARVGFKFFVEDNPENAIRVADLCEYVFLFDEPYNQSEFYVFPKNVIRVKTWNEVYRYLKILS